MKLHWLLLLACSSLANAQLAFNPNPVDVHVPPDATIVMAELPFTNAGTNTVEITRAKPDCTCIAVEISNGKLRYAPGESGVIRATIDVGNKIGSEEQVVLVWLKGDTEEKPSIQVPVRIHIPQLVTLDTKSLKWELGAEKTPKSIQITMAHDKPIQVTKVSSTSQDFRLELVTHQAGTRYELIVTPLNTAQQGMAIVRVETDCPVQKQRIQQAFAMVIQE